MCCVQVYDWDLFGTDDLIGETKIDLENRFYSRHRATCGLPRVYETLVSLFSNLFSNHFHYFSVGPNQWRDSMKPTQILAKLCKDHKISGPNISGPKVKVGQTTFRFGDVLSSNHLNLPPMSDEQMALAVLHNWTYLTGELVSEHIETRALYHPDKPGI